MLPSSLLGSKTDRALHPAIVENGHAVQTCEVVLGQIVEGHCHGGATELVLRHQLPIQSGLPDFSRERLDVAARPDGDWTVSGRRLNAFDDLLAENAVGVKQRAFDVDAHIRKRLSRKGTGR